MNTLKNVRFIICLILLLTINVLAQPPVPTSAPRFRALALTERGGQHEPFVVAGLAWLNTLAADSNFAVDVIENTEQIDTAFLQQYRVFIQLNYPPYNWTPVAAAAFENYIDAGGAGGWIGFHHATLLGEFDGFPLWQWFSDFMGGIRFDNYIAELASGTVRVEDMQHPCMAYLPDSFVVANEEWYTWNVSPRPNVQALASVDESTYTPDSPIKMGDHPVVWCNTTKQSRNIYILMGHHPDLFKNTAFTTLFRNAIFWAAGSK